MKAHSSPKLEAKAKAGVTSVGGDTRYFLEEIRPQLLPSTAPRCFSIHVAKMWNNIQQALIFTCIQGYDL